MAYTRRKKYKRKAGSLTKEQAATKLQSTYKNRFTRRSNASRKIQSRQFFKSKNICPICLDEDDPITQTNYFQTDCKHIFHVKCIKKYCKGLAKRNINCNCPICRQPLTLQAESMKSELKVEKANSDLVKSCKSGNLEDFNDAIYNGANINAQDKFGFTPLHYASLYGNLEIVKLLIELGSNIEARTNFGRLTPLLCASKYGHTQVVQLLEKAKKKQESRERRETRKQTQGEKKKKRKRKKSRNH